MSDNPMMAAQQAARTSRSKRFYRQVTVAQADAGHAVLLDGRPVRTPARRPLALPTAALAEAVAEEWCAQHGTIEPDAMPLTRLVNSAIDGVAAALDDVRADIVRFSETDLVCYRADGPDGLVAAQRRHWDPVVHWAREVLGVQLVLAEGVMHVAQHDDTPRRVAAALAGRDAFALAALHTMTALTGSCLIALAVADGRLDAEEAWAAAHVDEDWQIGRWGADPEAMARREARWREMAAAARTIALLGG